MEDKVREFWDRRPCNMRHSSLDIDEFPLAYSRGVTARKYFVEPHIPRFAEFHRWRGKWVIDLGCGIGTQALSFARHGAHVAAVDFSERSLEIARKRARAECLEITFINANIERLYLLPRYDLVWMFGVLHHTPDPDAVLDQVCEMLVPGGTFKLMVYNAFSYRGAQLFLQRQMHDTEAQPGCPISRLHTRRGVRRQLERHGLKVTSMKIWHIFPWSIPEYIKYEYKTARPWRHTPTWLFSLLSRCIGWHLLVEAQHAF